MISQRTIDMPTKDIGRRSITIGLNTIYCFGIGFERYPIVEWTEDAFAPVSAWVMRFDFLFFFINFTKFPKVDWRE
jgi:hypothetical protein